MPWKNLFFLLLDLQRLEFDTITVTNPNGTISKYTNSYPYLLQSGTFNIIKENFGEQNSVIIWIRRLSENKGKMIGNGTSYSLSSGYFFFHIGIHVYQRHLKFLTLNCSDSVPCTILVRKIQWNTFMSILYIPRLL